MHTRVSLLRNPMNLRPKMSLLIWNCSFCHQTFCMAYIIYFTHSTLKQSICATHYEEIYHGYHRVTSRMAIKSPEFICTRKTINKCGQSWFLNKGPVTSCIFAHFDSVHHRTICLPKSHFTGRLTLLWANTAHGNIHYHCQQIHGLVFCNKSHLILIKRFSTKPVITCRNTTCAKWLHCTFGVTCKEIDLLVLFNLFLKNIHFSTLNNEMMWGSDSIQRYYLAFFNS